MCGDDRENRRERESADWFVCLNVTKSKGELGTAWDGVLLSAAPID